MQETLRDVEEHDRSLKRPYRNLAFAATTYNLGPQTACWPHRDCGNGIVHLCADGGLGLFDWTLGRHLIIHEARLVIQLRPGDIILFPSTLLTHENIPVQPHESRYSFTAYSAGGLERFRQQGMMLQDAWEAANPEAAAALLASAPERWREARGMFQTVEELQARYAEAVSLRHRPQTSPSRPRILAFVTTVKSQHADGVVTGGHALGATPFGHALGPGLIRPPSLFHSQSFRTQPAPPPVCCK